MHLLSDLEVGLVFLAGAALVLVFELSLTFLSWIVRRVRHES